MLLQAILLGLVAMLGNAEYLFGTSLLSRPLVMGTLTGICTLVMFKQVLL